MLSRHLVTEDVVAEIARVAAAAAAGVLLSVDSLVLGMAMLAEQNYWAHLSDVPRSEVVLVPWPDGTITRCFGVEQLRELLTDVRPGGRVDPAAYGAVPLDRRARPRREPAGPPPARTRRADRAP